MSGEKPIRDLAQDRAKAERRRWKRDGIRPAISDPKTLARVAALLWPKSDRHDRKSA